MASVTQRLSSDSDEDPETGPVQARVLPVADLTHCDERVPPASGAEYLRRVQLQAQRCPDVVTSDRRPPLASPRDAAQSVADTDAGFKRCPSSQCLAHDVQRAMAADFSFLRQELDQRRWRLTKAAIERMRARIPCMNK